MYLISAAVCSPRITVALGGRSLIPSAGKTELLISLNTNYVRLTSGILANPVAKKNLLQEKQVKKGMNNSQYENKQHPLTQNECSF